MIFLVGNWRFWPSDWSIRQKIPQLGIARTANQDLSTMLVGVLSIVFSTAKFFLYTNYSGMPHQLLFLHNSANGSPLACILLLNSVLKLSFEFSPYTASCVKLFLTSFVSLLSIGVYLIVWQSMRVR